VIYPKLNNLKNIHLYIFGVGNVGSTLIDQVLQSRSFFKQQHGIDLRIVGLANSKRVLLDLDGISKNWKENFGNLSEAREADSFYKISSLYDATKIAIDATASKEVSQYYPELLENDFNIVTANKIANTLSQEFYDLIRTLLITKNLGFEYETNVGAGLPIIQSVKDLYSSGEQLFAINGVFSGSLSYIFNRFSEEDKPFSEIVIEALKEGYTEPDPREDLSGNDVARKLLVLAREAGLKLEFDDIQIENLVIPSLRTASLNQFLDEVKSLDPVLQKKKDALEEGEVLRHLGELDVVNRQLKVSLKAVKKESPSGQLKGSDGFFEIYSESYATNPLVIKGAGAGKAVTARGLLSDIIKVSKSTKEVLVAR
jgi:aspartokinase/homoserine dehydrogenase 1